MHSALGVVENMVEIDPEIATVLVETTPLLRWLLGRARAKTFDENKLCAAPTALTILNPKGLYTLNPKPYVTDSKP